MTCAEYQAVRRRGDSAFVRLAVRRARDRRPAARARDPRVSRGARDRRPVNEYPFWLDTLADSAIRNPQSAINNQSAIRSPQSTINPQSAVRNPQWSSAPRRVDVAIVGAGYTGLAAARHLAGPAPACWCSSARRRLGGELAQRRSGAHRLEAGRRDARRALRGTARAAAVRRGRRVDRAARSADRRGADRLRVRAHRPHPGRGQAVALRRAFREEQALLARVFNHRVESCRGRSSARDRHRRLSRPAGRRAKRRAEPGAVRAGAGRRGRARGRDDRDRRRASTGVDRHAGRGASTRRGEVEAARRACSRPTATPIARRPRCSGGSSRSAATSSRPSRCRRRRRRRFCRAGAWRSIRSIFSTTSGSPRTRRLLFGGRAEFAQPTAESTGAPRRSCAAT